MELLKGSEFVRRVQRVAKKKGIRAEYKAERGKGSHGTLYFGDKRTVVRNLKDELKTGTFHAMLKQLGIKDSDLE
jgi:mRNA interferase HicA